jgi:hypothetical protein
MNHTQFAQDQSDSSSQEMKKCPFCAESIRSDAIKCRFCQTMLVEQQPVLIECTSKVYKRAMYDGKALQALGILVIIASVWISFYVSMFWQNLTVGTAIVGVIMIIGGFIRQKWGEHMAWWNNG